MIKRIKPNIWQFNFREFGSCVYLVKLKEHNILIDTGSTRNKDEILEDLKKLSLNPGQIDIILLTHNHWDHTGNINLFSNAKLYTNSSPIKEIKVINSPGHTSDSVCFLYQDVLFSGDVIFHNGNIGRTDFPESSPQLMQKSLEKLKKINYKILCPGHLV